MSENVKLTDGNIKNIAEFIIGVVTLIVTLITSLKKEKDA